jgi:Ca2+-binding RTX toxin-like protein
LLVAAVLVPAAGAGAAGPVVGYPRCNLDDVASDYTWWADGQRVAVTEEPHLEWEGILVDANQVDCAAAIDCIIMRPDLAGRAATIVGTDDDDHLIGTNGPDFIIGGGGSDHLEGRRGRDTLCGGPGNDLLKGGLGPDRLMGESGNDVVRGGLHSDLVRGGSGYDALFGGRGDDVVWGGPGSDSLYGGPGEDVLRGAAGRDVCFGGAQVDRFATCEVAAAEAVEYGTGAVSTFRVQIDDALDESRLLTTAYVDWILSDDRSWLGDGSVKWRRVGPNDTADLTIILAAPATVDSICFPLRTGGYFSCRNGDTIGINVNRWNTATSWWPASLRVYRTYVVNHEVGHFLGHGHATCPGAGLPADVMQQQTKQLDGCVANGWVFPGEQS